MLDRTIARVKARWLWLENYFYYTARPRSVSPIALLRRRREARARKEIAADAELARVIAYTISESSSTGCSWSDYWELYRAIRVAKPRHVLECGSGITSVVIAMALSRNCSESGVQGLVTSMEDQSAYHEQIVAIFPGELQSFAELRVSPAREVAFGSEMGTCYSSVPERPYEVVFIDGPQQRSPLTGRKLFNADFVNVVRMSDIPVRGILDQRVATMWALRRILVTADIRYSVVKQMTFIRASKHDLTIPEELACS